MSEKRNAYTVLGLVKGASDDQIKQAYVGLVKKYDPEKHTEKFMIVQDAFNRLKDPKKRALEDILSFNELPLDFSFTEQEKVEVEDAKLNEAVDTLEGRLQADPDGGAQFLPKLVQAYSMRAWSSLKKKLLEQALADWRRIAELDPTHQRAKNNLLCSHCKVGFRYASHRLFDEAIEEWEKAVRMNPDNHLLIHNLALACEFGGRIDQALRYWQETLRRWKTLYERDPSDEYLKTCIIEAHRHQGEVAESRREAEAQAAAPPPPPAPEAAPQARAAVAQRPVAPAGGPAPQPQAAPQAAPAGAPRPAQAPPAPAQPSPQAIQQSKEHELNSQLEILKLNPDDFDANFKVGKLYLELRRWSDAVAHFMALQQKWPQNLEIVNALGFAQMNNQEVENAFRTWNRGLKLEPKNYQIREALIKAHMMMGRALRDKNLFVNALVHFKALEKLLPESEEVHFEMGRTYQAKGDKRSAFLSFNTVLKINPKHKQARVCLSDLKIQR